MIVILRWLSVFLLIMMITGCSDEKEKLTRIDVTDEIDKGMVMVNSKKLDSVKSIFNKVTWENAKVQMDRKEDVFLSFFYQYDKNMPERIKEYRVWFNDNGGAELIGQNTYAKLGNKDADKLKKVLNEKGDYVFE